jgi:endonuclease/exonuclease/phosphatase family metal-dependent hydrolase
MVRSTGIFIALFFLFISAASAQERTPLTVMSYNIRLDVASDGVNAWPNRKELLAGLIRFHSPDIVGLQEAQIHQLKHLTEALPEYAWLGVGRDDGKEAGEFMAILYRKDRIEPLHSSTFWCSPNPSAPGLGWDAAFNRVVTWGRFKDTRSKQTFFLFNTHLDHIGVNARRESARLLMDSVRAISGTDPGIITGDFNSRPADEPYQTVIAPNTKRTFRDTRTISRQPHYGPEGTFNGFNITEYANEPIDYIFVPEGTEVLSHATLTDSFHGRFPSDHFPVITTILPGRTPKKAR